MIQKQGGQAMLITTLFISGLILVATTVAGFLVSTQIRQATNIELSTQALFAADAGLEEALYCYRWEFRAGADDLNEKCGTQGDVSVGNTGAKYFMKLELLGNEGAPTGFDVTSAGSAGRTRRVLETTFLIES